MTRNRRPKAKFNDPIPYKAAAGPDPRRWAAADTDHRPDVRFVAGNPVCSRCHEPAREKTGGGWEHGEEGYLDTGDGSGLDANAPTRALDGSVITATAALGLPPTQMMRRYARQVKNWLNANGQRSVDVVASYDRDAYPGAMMIRWAGPITPEQVAGEFGSIPVWMELVPDDHSDPRYIRQHHRPAA